MQTCAQLFWSFFVLSFFSEYSYSVLLLSKNECFKGFLCQTYTISRLCIFFSVWRCFPLLTPIPDCLFFPCTARSTDEMRLIKISVQPCSQFCLSEKVFPMHFYADSKRFGKKELCLCLALFMCVWYWLRIYPFIFFLDFLFFYFRFCLLILLACFQTLG